MVIFVINIGIANVISVGEQGIFELVGKAFAGNRIMVFSFPDIKILTSVFFNNEQSLNGMQTGRAECPLKFGQSEKPMAKTTGLKNNYITNGIQ